MITVRLPRKLHHNGQTHVYSGSGRTPGSHMFLDCLSGKCLELFVAVVQRTGPHHTEVSITGNPALGAVRLPHRALPGAVRSGDALLVGPLSFNGEGPKAFSAWRLHDRANGQDRPARGVISSVKAPDWGFITPADGGEDLFVHLSQLRGPTRLRVGQRVSFRRRQTRRGLSAVSVRAA